MNKKVPVSLVVAVILVAMTVTFSMTMIISQRIFNQNVSSVQEKSAMYDKLAKIDIVARNNFYGQIQDDVLMDTMAAGYVAGLGDKNNKYYTKTQYTDLLSRQAGKLMGLGFDIVKDSSSGYFKIITVYNDSPASEIGMAKSDNLTMIGEVDVRTLSLEQAKVLLQGAEGTGVNITYLASATGEEKKADLLHRAYSVPSVTSQLSGANGYVKITDFNKNTPVEFDTQVQNLVSNGAKSLIFDVRDNGSTDLDSVHRVLDIIMPSGTLVSGEYKNVGSDKTTIKTLYTSDVREIKMPMVVVVNENTAFGGELFAIDLQETNKAKVVGNKTAGKGGIQKIFVQPDGSALELTVAKMLTSKGTAFDTIGIEPNFKSELSDEQKAVWYDLTITDDPQLMRAVEVAENLIKGIATEELTLTTSPAPDADTTPVNEAVEGSSSSSAA